MDYMDGDTCTGYEVELMEAIAAKMGLECVWLPPTKFDTIIPLIKQGGKADVGASSFTITDERKEEVDFTNAYLDSNQGVATLKSASVRTRAIWTRRARGSPCSRAPQERCGRRRT